MAAAQAGSILALSVEAARREASGLRIRFQQPSLEIFHALPRDALATPVFGWRGRSCYSWEDKSGARSHCPAALMYGFGGFAGAGEQFGLGIANAPTPSGFSNSGTLYGEGDVGLGIGAGVSGQAAFDKRRLSSISGGVGGKLGVGVGAYVGAGKAFGATYASQPYGYK